MGKTCIISGCAGQDASYLADYLLTMDYDVVGFVRRHTTSDWGENIVHLKDNPRYHLEHADVTDMASIIHLLQKYKVDEFYSLAAQSFVAASWQEPLATFETNASGVQNILEAVRLVSPTTKVYQASTSEVYGDVQVSPQNEDTAVRPRSPYGAAKASAEHLVKTYRESYGIFACFGRLFNHESSRRGPEFVTRKITMYVAKLYTDLQKFFVSLEPQTQSALAIVRTKDEKSCVNTLLQMAIEAKKIEPLHLGNLQSGRDWGSSKDFVKAMHLMLQQEKPDDFVIATGIEHSISDFLDVAFGIIKIDDWSKLVVSDPKFYRPADVVSLCGDSTKARNVLGWKPETTFEQLVAEMVTADINRLIK